MRLITAAASLVVACCSSALLAAPPPLALQPLVSGFGAPLEMVQPDDASGRLFVVEQVGRLRIVKDGVVLPTPYLDISQARGGAVYNAGGEQGLLGLAFDPHFTTNGRFYVHYTRARPGDPSGSDVVIERFTQSATNPDIADPASGTVLLIVPHPSFPNHNGGKLAFGHDGFLYIGIGDGGGTPESAQALTDLRGKILRIDVSGDGGYSIPGTNPFAVANPAMPARPEIWAYGLRNPFRFSFDRDNGDLFIGDVGLNVREEVDFEPLGTGGGRNYGWDVFEGTQCSTPPTGCSLPGSTPPIIEYPHDATGGFAIVGGFRYRGEALPALQGFYIYSDFATGHIWAATPDNTGTWNTTLALTAPAGDIAAIGEDASGELYVVSVVSGTVSRLTPAATTIPRAVNISTRGRVGTGSDVLIGGFIIGGDRPKTVVVTGAGPSLQAAGVANPLANPTLTVVRSSDSTIIASNDDWQDGPDAARIIDAGFAPADSRESAVMLTLPPGAYTSILSGADGGMGDGLVAVFEVDHPEVPLIDIATRGQVLGDEDVLIGGFVIQGDAPRTVVITAIGPSLAAAGVGDALSNPTLTLVRSSDQSIVASNVGWQNAGNAAAIQQAGFAPSDARESAVMATLGPGAYTAIVSGANGATGVGIVAVYEIGP